VAHGVVGGLQAEPSPGLLPHQRVRAVLPARHPVLGRLLDQQGGNRGQDSVR